MKRSCPPGRDPARPRRRRRSLQLRLFTWAGVTILVTGLVVGVTGWLTSSGSSGWHRAKEGANAIAARRFAEVWDDPAARAALATEVSSEMDVGVATFDAAGRPLDRFGPVRERAFMKIPIERQGERVGRVEISVRRFRTPAEIALPLGLALIALWGASGFLARRLARPLADLASTADAIGRGDLDRRTRVTRHAPAEVAKVAEAMDDMAARIQRQMVDSRELLAAVSHEVRSPLARIRLLTELARPEEEGERRRALDEIDREVEEIDALVGSLLASSRLDFGTLDPREMDALAVARDALLRAGLPARLLVAPEVMDPVRADPTLIARALANLVENARTHGGGVSALRVTPGPSPGEVTFEVDDDGPGLGDDAEHMFQAFHRRAGTHGALGLGLAIVARIAEAHGGRAFAEDREPAGARIGFSIAGRAASDPVASAP
jgi:two-component system OmpR family sensor kinase